MQTRKNDNDSASFISHELWFFLRKKEEKKIELGIYLMQLLYVFYIDYHININNFNGSVFYTQKNVSNPSWY
jgi:hypothetical protein